jgi:hypothetical protein
MMSLAMRVSVGMMLSGTTIVSPMVVWTRQGWPVGITDWAIIKMMAVKNNSMSSLVLIFHGKGIHKK